MPVWHERIRCEAREGFRVVGITEEQHPDRCRLFAQWHGIDWPILWDPFNLTGSLRVPLFLAVDEHGVVQRQLRGEADMDWFFGEFLDAEYPMPAAAADQDVPVNASRSSEASESVEGALSALLFGSDAERRAAFDRMAMRTREAGVTPAEDFRAGVALRMRFDSQHARPGDFQGSLDAWTRALAANPNQYIWRRRIQQWGPRLDKPYPFYGWIEEARAAIRARGEEPHALPVPLTGSELAPRASSLAAAAGDEVDPDPLAEVRRDERDLVAIDTAIARHTGDQEDGEAVTARVHVVLRPDAAREVHWGNEVGPTTVWLDLPDGWRAEQRRFTLTGPDQETSDEVRQLDFEIVLPADLSGSAELNAYALYFVCEGASGECLYLRRDFTVRVR